VSDAKLCVVRLWDGMDGAWIDVTEPIPEEEANRIWNEKTKNGTEYAEYDDIDYYKVFPADTVMHWSGDREMFR